MKTPEQIVEYINNQEWYKNLGVGIANVNDFGLLILKVLLAYPVNKDRDWKKINEDFQKWLAE